MARRAQKVGRGVSERINRPICFNTSTPAELQAFFESVNAAKKRPWRGQADIIASARKGYEEARSAQPNIHADLSAYNRYYDERVTEAWYLKEIVGRANDVERALDKGDGWSAVEYALFLGELFTEMRLKFGSDVERAAQIGQPMIENGLGRRKGSQVQRVAAVDSFVAGGMKITKAFAAVAASEGSSPKTIEADYYKAKKTS